MKTPSSHAPALALAILLIVFVVPCIAIDWQEFDNPDAFLLTDDLQALKGKWKVTSAERNGGDYPKEMIAAMFVEFTNDQIRVYVEGTRSEQAAKFKIDAHENPKQIDFVEQTVDREWQRDMQYEAENSR